MKLTKITSFCIIMVCFISTDIYGKLLEKYKIRIVMLDFDSNSSSESLSRIIRNIFQKNFFETNSFEIIEYEKRSSLLDIRDKMIERCTSDECALRIGKELFADYIITGSLDDEKDKYIVTIKVISMKEKRVVINEIKIILKDMNIRNTIDAYSTEIAEKVENIKELENSGIFGGYPFILSLNFHYIKPSNYFKKTSNVKDGKGVTINARIEDLYINRLFFGLFLHYFYFYGLDSYTEYSTMTGVNFLGGYLFKLDNFSLSPFISCGISYNQLYYFEHRDSQDSMLSKGFEPLFSTGILFEYKIRHNIFLNISYYNYNIFEKSGRIYFHTIALGMSFLL